MEKLKKKILLVEDDPLILQIYKNRLVKAGFEVVSVSSGEEVMGKLRNERFDMVLLDIVLPEKSGFEILRKMKEDGELEKTKTLILSNIGEKEKVERALNMGVVDYLIKAHHTPSDVVSKIEEII